MRIVKYPGSNLGEIPVKGIYRPFASNCPITSNCPVCGKESSQDWSEQYLSLLLAGKATILSFGCIDECVEGTWTEEMVLDFTLKPAEGM